MSAAVDADMINVPVGRGSGGHLERSPRSAANRVSGLHILCLLRSFGCLRAGSCGGADMDGFLGE
jgi:hypothetical protein